MRRIFILIFVFWTVIVYGQTQTVDNYWRNSISQKLSMGNSLISQGESLAGIECLQDAVNLAFNRSNDKQSALIVLNSDCFITLVNHCYSIDSDSLARTYLDKHLLFYAHDHQISLLC